MKTFISIVTVICISTLVAAPSYALFGKKETTHLLLIIDNSMVSPAINQTATSEGELEGDSEEIPEDEGSRELKVAIEWLLAQLLHIRDRRTTVTVLLTTQPNSTLFSGVPSAFEKDARRIVDEATNLTDTCSDLKLAFEHAMTERQSMNPPSDNLDVVILSSMIHVPFPCGQESGVEIMLPQPINPGIGLAELAKESVSVRHYFVEGDQQKMLVDFYNANKLMGTPDSKVEVNGVAATNSLMYNPRNRIFTGD